MNSLKIHCDNFCELLELYYINDEVKKLVDKHVQQCDFCLFAKEAWEDLHTNFKFDSELELNDMGRKLAKNVFITKDENSRIQTSVEKNVLIEPIAKIGKNKNINFENKVSTIPRDALPWAAGNNDDLQNIPKRLLRGKDFLKDVNEIKVEKYIDGYKIRIEGDVTLSLNIQFFKKDQMLYETEIYNHFQRDVIPYEEIEGYTDIKITEVE